VRQIRPQARIVVGGYDPSLAPDAYAGSPEIDFIVRGEGEQTFCQLLRTLENGGDPAAGAGPQHTAPPPIPPLRTAPPRLPNRAARVLRGYTMLGRTVDVVETSRGCTYDCSFCSIIEMRGRNFHPYAIDRVLADIADARAHGAEAIFLVDDNITL